MNATAEILKLKSGESWTWPEGDYGRAEIWRINDVYVLFEIPNYGGEPRFVETFGVNDVGLDRLIKTVQSWT